MSAAEPDANWPEDEEEDGGTIGGAFRHWGRLGGIVAALAMSGLFAVAAWQALQRADLQSSTTVPIPYVRAEPGPVKEKPKDPGGLKIPNQDKLVFERINPDVRPPVAEKLAPAPEEPIVKTVEAVGQTPRQTPAAPTLEKPEPAPDRENNEKTPEPLKIEPMTAEAKVEKVREHMAPPAIIPEPPKPAEMPKPGMIEKPAAPKLESLLPAAKSAGPMAEGKPAEATLPTPKEALKTVTAAAKPPAPAPLKPSEEKPEPKKAAAAETTEIKAPAVAPPAAKTTTVKAVKAMFRIQISAHRSAARAAASWEKLRRAHGAIVGSLIPHTERADLGKRGIYFRVQAGNFKTAAEARAVCAKLKAKRQDCVIVRPKK
jgi:hypothetical protein